MNPFRSYPFICKSICIWIIISQVNPLKVNPFLREYLRSESLQKWIPSEVKPFKKESHQNWIPLLVNPFKSESSLQLRVLLNFIKIPWEKVRNRRDSCKTKKLEGIHFCHIFYLRGFTFKGINIWRKLLTIKIFNFEFGFTSKRL